MFNGWRAEERSINIRNIRERFFNKDTSIWSGTPEVQDKIANRLGWINVADTMLKKADKIYDFVEKVRADGFGDVVLLGMGGSSLCPSILERIFGSKAEWPNLFVLDTTDSRVIIELEKRLVLERTLFIVASKSGTTAEPLSLYKYFWQRVKKVSETPGRQFIAITDADTPLVVLAKTNKFRTTFINPGDIGGRYSALSYFGLVPAALIGIDIRVLLNNAVAMADVSRKSADDDPVFNLGVKMAEQAVAGHDKLTLMTSPKLTPFGLWVEQLIAESTGKQGKGVIPITGEPPAEDYEYGHDRFFVLMRLGADDEAKWELRKENIRRSGNEFLEIRLDDLTDLGGEFWRWEAAVAICGAKLEINPFDEPNVAESKENTARLLTQLEAAGDFERQEVAAANSQLVLRIGPWARAEVEQRTPGLKVTGSDADGLLKAYLTLVKPGKYLVLLAFWPETEASVKFLNGARSRLSRYYKVATAVGFGP
ncbi:MAG TPA: transaldolase, partial [Actinobacteria bacterium]|nr:transaldolase [Actinomycetes bacterium]HEX21468.1 transaldolase [Actinomycetota bacterium]